MQQDIELNKELLSACLSKSSSSIDLEKVRSLLERGADPNYSGQCNLFPNASNNPSYTFPILHVIAGKENSTEVAQLLIEYGAELDKVDSCIMNTPLLTAIALRDEKLARFLILAITSSEKTELRKVLNQQDVGKECQNTPCVLALKKDMDKLALLLIQVGVDVNITCRDSETALHWACMLRKNDVVKALLQKGAQFDRINRFGRVPSEYYCYQMSLIDIVETIGHTDVVSFQANMSEFSDLYFHTSENSQDDRDTSLQARIEERNATNVDPQLVNLMMAVRTSPLTLQQQHEAIVKDQYSKIKTRADRYNSLNSNPNFSRSQERYGISSTATALKKIVHEIETKKENIRFKDAPLSRAVKYSDREAIQKLLTSNTNVNASCTEGYTALHWAAMRRDNEMIRKLVARGADFKIKNKYQRTPLDYYTYQLRAADFKSCLHEAVYSSLAEELALGEAQMPEFQEIFQDEPHIRMGTPARNKKPIDLALFSTILKPQGLVFLVDVDDTLMCMEGEKPIFNTKLISYLKFCGVKKITLLTRMDADHGGIAKAIRQPLIEELLKHGIEVTAVITPLDIVFMKSGVIPNFKLGDSYKLMLPVEQAIAELRLIPDFHKYESYNRAQGNQDIISALHFLLVKNIIHVDDQVGELVNKGQQIDAAIKHDIDGLTLDTIKQSSGTQQGFDYSFISTLISNRALLEKNKEKTIGEYLEELQQEKTCLERTVVRDAGTAKIDKCFSELLLYRRIRYKCYAEFNAMQAADKQPQPTKGDVYSIYLMQDVAVGDTVVFIDDSDREHASLHAAHAARPVSKDSVTLVTMKPPEHGHHFKDRLKVDPEATFRHNIASLFGTYMTFRGITAVNEKNFQLAIKCFKTAFLFCKDQLEPEASKKILVTMDQNIMSAYRDLGNSKGAHVTETEVDIDRINQAMNSTEPQTYDFNLLMFNLEFHKRQHPECYTSYKFGFLSAYPDKIDSDFEARIINRLTSFRQDTYKGNSNFLQKCSACLGSLLESLRIPVYRKSIEDALALLKNNEPVVAPP